LQNWRHMSKCFYKPYAETKGFGYVQLKCDYPVWDENRSSSLELLSCLYYQEFLLTEKKHNT
jgi:hypothetical protein